MQLILVRPARVQSGIKWRYAGSFFYIHRIERFSSYATGHGFGSHDFARVLDAWRADDASGSERRYGRHEREDGDDLFSAIVVENDVQTHGIALVAS